MDIIRILVGTILIVLSSTSMAKLHVVEFRRTFSASECSTGEVIVDGLLKAFFFASPTLFSSKLENDPIIGDSASSEVFSDIAPYLAKRTLGARISNSGVASIRLVALDDTSYWQYERLRKKARTLPNDIIIVGTKLINRECTILSKGEDNFYDTNYYYAWTSDILAASLFEGKLSRLNYLPSIETEAIFLLSDSSTQHTVSMEAVSATMVAPRDAIDISSGDGCLTKLEHMGNSFVKTGGAIEYRRRDDVWFCTEGKLIGTIGKVAIEMTVDLRYWELISDEICATVLGLPVNRRYLIGRLPSGESSGAWSRCLATDAWTKLTDKASVTYR